MCDVTRTREDDNPVYKGELVNAAAEAAEEQGIMTEEREAASAARLASEDKGFCLLGHNSSGGCNGAGAVREAGNALSDASAAAGFLGTVVAFCGLPICEAAAGMLQTASIGLGLASSMAYMAGGDKDDAIDALAGTAVGFLLGGVGKQAGTIASRGADEVASSFIKGGASGLIDDSFEYGGKTVVGAGVQTAVTSTLSLLGNAGDAAFVANGFSNPFDTDPGAN
jgi:hypothetical protein